jgi:hypothetical protein
MTKRPNSPNAAPPPKRSRKPAGFRVARRPPTNSQTPSGSSANSSLFITVSQPDERRVTLEANSRVISSASTQSQPPSISPEAEQWNDSTCNSGAEIGPPPEQEPVKPKRKRKTKNTVCNFYHISCLLYSNLSSGPSRGMAQIQKHIFGRTPSTRWTWRFFKSYRMLKLSKGTRGYKV